MCVLIHFFFEFPYKIIFPCFGYQLHSCILCWINISFNKDLRFLLILEFFLVLIFFYFGRCMFFYLVHGHRVKLFDLDLVQLKNSSFSMSIVFFVTFQSVPFFKGLVKNWEKLKCIQVGNSCLSIGFPSSSILTFLHCYLVMYVVRGCH